MDSISPNLHHVQPYVAKAIRGVADPIGKKQPRHTHHELYVRRINW